MRALAFGQAIIRAPVDWPDAVRALAEGAGAVAANLEGCLPPPGAFRMKAKTVHPAHPEALAALAALGVSHLALANNHVWDYGPAGVIATREAALAVGFAVAGAGRTLAEAAAPALSRGLALIAVDLGPTPDWAIAGAGPGVNPLRLTRVLGLPGQDLARLRALAEATGDSRRRDRRLAMGYDAPTRHEMLFGLAVEEADAAGERHEADPADLDRLAGTIAAARAEADLVLVTGHYHHWAPDWQGPPAWLAPLARQIAAAGADALAFHGPPIAYPLWPDPRCPVAPGLGNLVFHTLRADRYDSAALPVRTGAALGFGDGPARLDHFDIPPIPGR